LCTELEYTGCATARVREQCPEIKVVGEHGPVMLAGKRKDNRVGRGGAAPRALVDCFPSGSAQGVHPRRAEIHVYQDSHATDTATSCSSERHAA
jgi:hypothetical protein